MARVEPGIQVEQAVEPLRNGRRGAVRHPGGQQGACLRRHPSLEVGGLLNDLEPLVKAWRVVVGKG